MGAMVSQITSLTTVYSTVNSGADQRKHQSSASLAFVRGIHRWPVNSPYKWPVTPKMFPFDDVIMDMPSPFEQPWGSKAWIHGCEIQALKTKWSHNAKSIVTGALKRKCHFDEIFVTSYTKSCQNDNFQCSEWRKFNKNDIFISSRVFITSMSDDKVSIIKLSVFIGFSTKF